MLELMLFDAEKKHDFLKIMLVGFLVSFILGFVNSFFGGISIFLIAFVCLAVSYPVTKFTRGIDRVSVKTFLHKSFFKRYEVELLVFTALFLGVVLGMFFSNVFGFTTDFVYEKGFVESISGNITSDSDFLMVLYNNLFVALNTFILSSLLFSGLIFVIVWNASIVAYYLSTLGSLKLAMVSGIAMIVHGLLEIGGYVWAGILGAIIAHRLAIYFFAHGGFSKKDSKKVLNKVFAFDCLKFFCLSVLFIVVGAFVETF